MTRTLFATCALAAVALVPLQSAHSASESVLYSFCSQTNCTDGATPQATLVADSSGNLYGTTEEGGASNDGEVFELAPDGALSVLHSFAKTDGAYPFAGVILDASGNLYGTTAESGSGGGCGDNGCGTVFKLAPDGTFSVLYAFGGKDGSEPAASLLLDGSGNLYGTTVDGGAHNGGEVFELAPDGTLDVRYSFCTENFCTDGMSPWAPVIRDSNGKLYGTTALGGGLSDYCELGCGTIFELSARGKENVLHDFVGNPDGANPYGAVTFAGGMSVLGIATEGGTHGDGTVFKLRGSGFDVLHEFHGKGDAQLPYAALIPDENGGYYGTSCAGGADKRGAVFHISSARAETVVYSFARRPDGDCPAGSLLDIGGALYGTTLFGGGAGCRSGCGTVFAIKEQPHANN